MEKQAVWRHKSVWRMATWILTVGLIAAAAPIYAYKVADKQDYTDFGVYYKAAVRAKAQAWDQIYNSADGASPYRYAPVILPLVRPFAELNPLHARMTWYILQLIFFALGFRALYQVVYAIEKDKKAAAWITSISFLFILRFCLDCFTIGQVLSLLFFFFAISLRSWVLGRGFRAGAALFIPSAFKIGPANLYGLFLLRGNRIFRRASLAAPLVLSSIAVGLTAIWLGSFSLFTTLWNGWIGMIRNDSVYYDASHYGSQSLKSGLLRMVNHGWISHQHAMDFYLSVAVIVCSSVAWLWFSRRPVGFLGRALFFSIGLFPYLWFMPETFKYALTVLAIPVALLLCTPNKLRQDWIFLGIATFLLSLGGLDIVGDRFFYWNQRASIPLLAYTLIAISIWRHSLRFSRPSKFYSSLSHALAPLPLGPWEPQETRKTQSSGQKTGFVSALVPLHLSGTATTDANLSTRFLTDLREHLSDTAGPRDFEILIIAHGDRVSEFHPIYTRIKKQLASDKAFTFLMPSLADSRGAALREAFVQSQGETIITAHLEQPCVVTFYSQARAKLAQGFDFVRGNRRLTQSRFQVSVRVLPHVYGRHRLGKIFNGCARLLLPIQTTDTHSGALVMTRRMAFNAFSLQSATDFLFDLEMSLTCAGHGFRETDLPIEIRLPEEKPRKRVFFEVLEILRGLPVLFWRYRQGVYRPIPKLAEITADDWGISPGVNQGILDLAKRGIVSRVSVMASCDYVEVGLKELLKVKGVQIGLHFNLTYGKSMISGCSSPGKLMKLVLNPFQPADDRKKLQKKIRKELQDQLSTLKDYGIKTVYLDGHHHIQIIPGVLDLIADILKKNGIGQVRLPYDPGLFLTPKFSISALALIARGKMKKYGLQFLPCFYPQHSHFLDHGKMRACLARRYGAEVIVHPAELDDLHTVTYPDSYTAGRVTEYKALRMLQGML